MLDVVDKLMEALLKEKKAGRGASLRRSMYKYICGGESGVGKTSIVERFCKEAFLDSYKPTFGFSIFSKVIDFEKSVLKLIIWDIAGLAELKPLRKEFYKGAQGALLVFDTTRPETLEPLKEWREEILNVCGEIPFVICGNKIDLEVGVSIEEVKEFAEEINAPLLFTSAKTGENIEEAFTLLTEKIHKTSAVLERTPSVLEKVSDLSDVYGGSIPLKWLADGIGCDLKTLESILIDLYEEGKISGWKIDVELGVLKRLLEGFEGKERISVEFQKEVQNELEEILSGLKALKEHHEGMMERLEQQKEFIFLLFDVINKNILVIGEHLDQLTAKIETKGRLSYSNS